jgi:putative serine protease PepD
MSTRARPNRRSWEVRLRIGAVAIVAGVFGGIAYAVGPVSTSVTASAALRQSSGSCNVTDVANKDLPALVTISVTGVSNGQVAGGTGSGEVIRSDGYIVTNNHVIEPAAGAGGSVTVLFNDGKTAPASIVGRDPLTDLAVIKVNGQSSLKTISFGSSSDVQVGAPVVVLGAPLGLSSTVTSGIVSALDRTIQVPGESGTALLVDATQTDAAINPGNSGGVLANCEGQMIGIPSAGASVPNSSGESSGGSIGLGFAIPSNLAKMVSDEIIADGTANHSYFGLVAEPLTTGGAVNGKVQGLLVTSVVSGGPSDSAGLAPGDLITSINGEKATDTTQLVAITLSKREGDKVELGYKRPNGSTATATVTLGTEP